MHVKTCKKASKYINLKVSWFSIQQVQNRI